jgi:hypothetical protein
MELYPISFLFIIVVHSIRVKNRFEQGNNKQQEAKKGTSRAPNALARLASSI